ncbi:MAG TPA: hypothetical protein VHZ51_18760 [Ktedonobacteraceae bacterium]|nr:hypothetical protein [Ktedonobacteraceae bacterium]
MTQFVFPPSAFIPLAIGFFGLGTGYFVWGGHALFGYPLVDSDPKHDVNRTMGMWGFWMPGFMQFLTGVSLLIGLTWFQVFNKPPASTSPLYMAALAFTAYGIHWFAMAHRRFIGSSDLPDAWMAIAFFLLSLLGVIVFFSANDIPVAIIFIGLSLIYLTEIPTRFSVFAAGGRLVGLLQILTGIWLMYMTWAVVLNFSIGAHWWV